MDNHTVSQISIILNKELDLKHPEDEQDQELLLQAIKGRVAYLLDRDPGLLFSYLYRLDVDESMVGAIMSGIHRADPRTALAHLILDRQLQRVETKSSLKQKPIEGWQW